MLRTQISEAMKTAMKARDERVTATTRMILAKLKDRDIDARSKGNADGIGEDEIQSMLQGMVKQRNESIALYEQGGRKELADQERAEIAIIERFLPQQMGDAEIEATVKALAGELGAASIKDMGKVMGALKARYTGKIDMTKASAAVKKALGG